MAEGSKGGEPGPEAGPVSKPASSFESAGGRLRFTVELHPEETTIVSWKKLVKEANLSMSGRPGPSVSGPGIQPQPVSQPPPPSLPVGASLPPPPVKEQMDPQVQAGSTRLNSVIERIERMYAGSGSSDDEDVMLDNVPDDDEYDTDDSFIDDAELDNYFQVDNSEVKHHGFFVNRGKLEHVESHSSNQQPKKRRLKDLIKGQNESDDGRNQNKTAKRGNKGKKASSMIHTSSTNVRGEDIQFQAAPLDAAEISIKKKASDSHDTERSSLLLDGGAIRQSMDIDGQMLEILSSKKRSSKLKESEPHDAATYKSNDKSSYASKTQSGKQPINADYLDRPFQRKEKGGPVANLNILSNRDSVPTMKAALMPRNDGSTVQTKTENLEKAIRELENIVAESRPPTEAHDDDNSSQAVKKRVPREIRDKLAEVASFAQDSNGEIPVDLINRLMSIVGHLMQRRTLKFSTGDYGRLVLVQFGLNRSWDRRESCLPENRYIVAKRNPNVNDIRNLRIMANAGLSAKQEKADRIEKIKQEVAEMVKQRIPYMKSKAEQLAANSDDFQEAGPEVKKVLKRKYSMDDALGNKICDLYDLYVERIDQDSGPPIRRLYQELVVLWPSGFMDTDGIKRAIYRVKERRGLCIPAKDREKSKNQKVLPPKRKDCTNVSQSSHNREKPLSDSLSPLTKKPTFSARKPVALAHGPKADRRNQEKAKGSSSGNNPVDAVASNSMPSKKLKKKPNSEALETQVRLEKLALSKADERPKLQKHVPQSSTSKFA
ncbi:wound-responsive family protein [Striga asiatica]|uniref:Wound-responsive family protein n=1 Tax=Striga asiatica TaxID=4170 RepID=A0A5A7Q508_STRAF|nr:wound-responsive family protein [Striga asiatica]